MRNHAKASPAGSSARGGTRLGRIVRGALATRGSSGDADGSSASTYRTARFGHLAGIPVAVVTLLAIIAAPAGASAFPEHTYLPELAHTATTGVVCGVATDSAGDYYVASSSAKTITVYDHNGAQLTQFATSAGLCKLDVDSSGRVYGVNTARTLSLRYKPEGGVFPPVSGTNYELDKSLNGNGSLITGGLGLGAVAIDPATQDVYVPAKAGSEVQEFATPAESFKLKCEGEETASLPSSATTEEIKNALEAAPVECQTVSVSEASGRIRVGFGGALENTDVPAIEVIKAGGNVSAWQMFNGSASPHVTSFQPDGTPISNTIGSGVAGAQYVGVDVYGKNGNVYVADKAHNKAIVFNNAGDIVLAEFNGSDSPAGAFDFSNSSSLPDVAVDQSNGHAYVSDMQAHHVVDEYDGGGNFVSQLSHSPAFEEGVSGNGIAVDNGASSPGKGRIYLTARTEAEVNRGVFAFGPLSAPSHTYLPELAHTATTGVVCGVATDSAGDYYVASSSAKTITVYDHNGAQLTQFATSAGLCKLDVDSSGRVYGVNTARTLSLRYKPEGGVFPPVSGTNYELDKSLNGNGSLITGGLGLGAVAIDPATQDVYVPAKAGSEVQEFATPAESFKLKCEGEETASLPSSATTEEIKNALEAAPVECQTVSVSEASGRIRVGFGGALENTDVPAIEVIKAGGNVSAWQMFNGSASPHVTSFQPDGTPISNTIGSGVAGAQYVGVDVYGKNGNVYVADKAHNKAIVFNNAGDIVLAEFNGSDSPAGAFDFSNSSSLPDVAVDQSNGHAYVSDMQAHHVVDEYDGGGNFVSQLSHSPAFEEGVSGNGIAVDNGASSPGKGRIYLTARTEAEVNRGVFAFGPLIYGLPLKVTKTGLGTGTVESAPVGIDCGGTCEAEFETGVTVKLTETANPGSVFTGWSNCDAVVSGECEVTLNEARQVSANFDAKPVIGGEAASQITDTSARLEALVNPKGKATSYRFEYLTEQAWEENGESFSGPKPPSKAPASAVPIGAGVASVAVAQKLSGLQPATTYRFRVVASSSVGTTEGPSHAFATFSPPDVFSGCPNESLRTGPGAALPDCRAYEQASAVDKGGSNATGSATGFTLAAPDGSAISFLNSAGLPGGVGSQDFPTYVAKRGPSGWATQGLLPDPSAGVEASVRGWTPDFSLVFDHAGSLAQGFGLFGRSTVGEPLSPIAPYVLPRPRYSYIGASADASTVLFGARPLDPSDATLKLTPEAAAGRPNVYAFNRGTGELRLAGVLPDGSTPAQGSVAQDPVWGEETYDQDLHAVSEDGSVFFTAADSEGQLYERLNAGEPETSNRDGEGNCVPDPVLACTIHVSATRKTNGKGPEGHDAAGTQPAVLRYASSDGARAIFTSSEKLTDDANTGIEPEAPAIARAKASDGSEKDIEFVPAFAQEIAVDETGGYVYWSDPKHGRIGRAKLDGTEADDNYIAVGGEPYGVAVVDEPSAEYVFWTDRGELEKGAFEQDVGKAGKGTIGRADLDGSNVNPSCYSGLDNPRSIAADAGYVYWTMPGLTEGDQNIGNGKLGRADSSCNEGSKNLNFLAKVEASQIISSGDVAVDATHIYISNLTRSGSRSDIFRCAIDGSECFHPVAAEVHDTNVPAELALDGTHLYWNDRDHNQISRSNLDGTNPEPAFITGAGQPGSLARAGENLLWTTHQELLPNPGSDLYEFDRESGELSDLAVDSGSENGIDAQGVLGASRDGAYVYFAANGVPDEFTGSPNANGESPAPGNCKGTTRFNDPATGTCNLYLAHGGQVTFIARLKANPVSEGVGEPGDGDAFDWVGGTDGGLANDKVDGKTARVSEDGRTLLFASQRQLTAYDNHGSRCKSTGGLAPVVRVPGPCPELYLYTVGQPGLVCVTCVPSGAAPGVAARPNSVRPPGFKPLFPARVMARNLSADGKRVFFESTDQLVAADTNGQAGCTESAAGFSCQDVYEWEAPDVGTCTEASNAYSQQNGGCIYLLSSGKGDQPSYFGDASESGDDVFIFTYDQLVPQDEDALMDVYDAKVDGGLASQHQAAPVPCEGEACKGPVGEPGQPASPGSASFSGPGNKVGERPAKPCPKGTHRVKRKGKSRCVKKHHHHRRHRRAHTTGRAGR